MRRFRFRLQSVLRLRSQVERAARRELALAMAEVDGFDRKIEAAAQGLADCSEQAARGDSVGQLARSLEDGLRRHRWRLLQQRQRAEQALDQVRADYALKARELKTMQNLHDSKREVWRQELIRHEQQELDELAMLGRGSRATEATSVEDSKW